MLINCKKFEGIETLLASNDKQRVGYVQSYIQLFIRGKKFNGTDRILQHWGYLQIGRQEGVIRIRGKITSEVSVGARVEGWVMEKT
jgi:hypothetical protein